MESLVFVYEIEVEDNKKGTRRVFLLVCDIDNATDAIRKAYKKFTFENEYVRSARLVGEAQI